MNMNRAIQKLVSIRKLKQIPIARFSIISFLAMTMLGCGYAKYEERLQASAEFYEYMENIDRNLASPIWERSDLGIKLRLPLPFRAPMPKPEVLQDEEGNTYYGPDSRHPQDSLGIELPGIVEAWQAFLPGESGEQVDSRIYVLTNHSRFILVDGALAEEPMNFMDDLEAELATVFDVIIPDGESNQPGDNVRYGMTVPPQGSPNSKFIDPKRYSVVRFLATDPENGPPFQAVLYEHFAGDIQAAVLVIGPKAFTSQFRQRVDLALQTFSVRPQASAQMNQSTGTATPSGGSSGF